jgi:hypothetical protein
MDTLDWLLGLSLKIRAAQFLADGQPSHRYVGNRHYPTRKKAFARASHGDPADARGQQGQSRKVYHVWLLYQVSMSFLT